MLLFGLIAVKLLPVEQYPDVAPPSLNVQAVYSGADAETLDRSVTSIIEDEMNGIENFLYMSSISRSNGTAQITLTLRPGTNLDIARTQVQDRLSRVEPRLPLQVRQLGVTVTKASSGFLMLIALQSKASATGVTAIGNFASNNIVNELRRIAGVGDVQLFGSSFGMRIWLDRDKLAGFGLSAAEVLVAGAGAEQPDRQRRPGRPAAGARLGVQRADRHPEPLLNARAVPRDHRARQSRRLDRAAGRRGAGRARQR